MTDENSNMEINGKKVSMHMPGLLSENHTYLGPILGALVVLLALVLGGLYLWGGMLSEEATPVANEMPVNNEPETPRADADTKNLETTSPSDELDAIEADIDATNLDSLDADLITADSELNAALPQ